MGIPSVSSLANMEFMLYGGMSGLNPNCPSYANGYRSGNMMYPSFYGYGSYPQNFSGNYATLANDATRVANPARTLGLDPSKAVYKSDWDTLGNYYIRQNAPHETLKDAIMGGVLFSALNNLRFLSNPWNSVTTIGKVEKMFAEAKNPASELYKLWKGTDTTRIMTDAYARMHKLEGGAMSRLGLFKARLDESVVKELRDGMEAALKSGKPEEIAKATEKIRVATNAYTGYVPRGWRWLKGKLGFETKGATVAEKLANTASIDVAAVKNLTEKSANTLTSHLKHSMKGMFGLSGALWVGMEFLTDWSKLKAAFSKDNETGVKQLTQTAVKGAGSAVGWAAGEAVGTWAGAALGAKIGTLVSPGIGTVIGTALGLIGGSIGMWAMGKVTHGIVGKDVGDKAQIAQMKSTPEGQAQLLQQTYQMAQEDKKLDPRTMMALQNVINQYSNAA